MAVSHVYDKGTLLSAGDMASDIVPEIYAVLPRASRVSLQAISTVATTHVGTIYFEVSQDQASWTSHSSRAVASGSAHNSTDDITTYAEYLRVRYESTSGDGILTVEMHASPEM
ncbi:MAG: hypothetical protein GY835_23895 [bacterium]|nr:hypothetical protein [bacterium]